MYTHAQFCTIRGVARSYDDSKMVSLKWLVLLAATLAVGAALPAQQFRKSGGNSTRVAGGTYGLDISSYVSESDFSCLRSQGFDFAIIRAYRSTGESSCTKHCTSSYVSVIAI